MILNLIKLASLHYTPPTVSDSSEIPPLLCGVCCLDRMLLGHDTVLTYQNAQPLPRLSEEYHSSDAVEYISAF